MLLGLLLLVCPAGFFATMATCFSGVKGTLFAETAAAIAAGEIFLSGGCAFAGRGFGSGGCCGAGGWLGLLVGLLFGCGAKALNFEIVAGAAAVAGWYFENTGGVAGTLAVGRHFENLGGRGVGMTPAAFGP
jgi:hypothetical protein